MDLNKSKMKKHKSLARARATLHNMCCSLTLKLAYLNSKYVTSLNKYFLRFISGRQSSTSYCRRELRPLRLFNEATINEHVEFYRPCDGLPCILSASHSEVAMDTNSLHHTVKNGCNIIYHAEVKHNK